MTTNLPSANFYTLDDLNLDLRNQVVDFNNVVLNQLTRATLTRIKNSFTRAMFVFANGSCFVHVSELGNLLRTGNGAHNYLWQNGIPGYSSSSDPYNIGNNIYISGPDFCGLLDARIMTTSGTQNIYLRYVRSVYQAITSSEQLTHLRTIFTNTIDNRRSQLKHDRMNAYSITQCEFSGEYIQDTEDVVFAHIDSVATSPLRALDINNGVIISREIHDELTRLCIHDFAGMYDFCIENNLDTDWAFYCEP